MNNIITYEQPLNEIIRVCLRLEQLFEQIDHQLTDLSYIGTRNVMSMIINVLNILDRPDLKAKLAKELSHHLATYMRYENRPDIDTTKLSHITAQLDELSRALIDSSGKIGHRLRDIELLNALRLHLASPGGGCGFDIPLYHYWLQQNAKDREQNIRDWLSDFTQIRSAMQLILDLVRKSAKVEQKEAIHGFYQELLDPQSNLRLIRIDIDAHLLTYPEISVGRHFLSIRFYSPDVHKKPVQYTENLIFTLSYCNS
jgi:cell division protein ZapD